MILKTGWCSDQFPRPADWFARSFNGFTDVYRSYGFASSDNWSRCRFVARERSLDVGDV